MLKYCAMIIYDNLYSDDKSFCGDSSLTARSCRNPIGILEHIGTHALAGTPAPSFAHVGATVFISLKPYTEASYINLTS